MPPRRAGLAFPESIMKKGYTALPNALDDLGLGPYHYRVLVFIIRWKGKATPEKPSIPIAVEYIAAKTGISVSKVKEVIHDLEHEYRLIAVHRRKRMRNLYDIRPLFAALLRNQAAPKATAPSTSAASEAAIEDGDGVEAPDADAEDEREQAMPSRPRFGSPRYGDAEAGQCEDEEASQGERRVAALRRPRGFGVPSYSSDDRIYPGMDEDDPTHDDLREEEEVREACERGEYIRGLTSVVVIDGARQVVPRAHLAGVREIGGIVVDP